MRAWRTSRLTRLVVLTLLFWTAADLTYASLCALDGQALNLVRTGAEPLAQAADQDATPSPAAQPHVDDCFCCSHCVDVSVISPANIVLQVVEQPSILASAAPSTFGSPLYHPPLV